MLIEADPISGYTRFAINNSSDGAELMADISYLAAGTGGTLLLDFTHMAAPLTQEKREEYLPGGFGYQPTLPLIEVLAAIGYLVENRGVYPCELSARLPNPNTRVGRFLDGMKVPQCLKDMGVRVEYAEPATAETGRDDSTRQNLIPITSIDVLLDGQPDFRVLATLRRRVESVLKSALGTSPDLADAFTTIIYEAVDNLIEYGQGGIIGGLFYPRMGEVEITLVNRHGGFGGTNPAEQLDALVSALEGESRRNMGGGNGMKELSRLALACFGTLLFRNGNALLRLPPDGSIVGTTYETGLTTPGASVTAVLQLQPTAQVIRSSILREFEFVLANSLAPFLVGDRR